VSTEAATINNQADFYPEEVYKELVEAGVFYGRSKSKTNPKMKPCVLTNRGGIEIINLAKTIEGLEAAIGFLKEKIRSGGLVLLVGTQPAAQDTIVRLAMKFNFPYVIRRWPGGALTNFKVISKRIEYFKKTKSDLAAGFFQKYTKKEQLDIEKEVSRLEELMGGLVNLNREPDVLLVIDPSPHLTAVREANRLNIPIIAFADVDSNPDLLQYPVVGNNKSRKSIDWFLGKIETAIDEGRVMQKEAAAAKEAEKQAEHNEK